MSEELKLEVEPAELIEEVAELEPEPEPEPESEPEKVEVTMDWDNLPDTIHFNTKTDAWDEICMCLCDMAKKTEKELVELLDECPTKESWEDIAKWLIHHLDLEEALILDIFPTE